MGNCGSEPDGGKGDRVLHSDDYRQQQPVSRTDSFDITFENRTGSRPPPTPRQQSLWSDLELPHLQQYPVPPGASPEEPPDVRRRRLLELYQEFVLEMHTGTYLTQLTSSRDYSDIHCQLMEDLTTMKLDQSNGRIIEFPLTHVSKVYRIVKNDDKWYSGGQQQQNGQGMTATEHIVVVEFMKRKLAFVFGDITASQRFLTCMELLIRRALQQQVGKSVRNLQNSFPPLGKAPGRAAATPRSMGPCT